MTKEQATIEYHELICGALDIPRMEGEVHHIVPRSCGGLDCDTNLVRLTCQEHFKAHELLPFIYDKGREHKAMVCAWGMMSGKFGGEEVSAEEYANLKKMYAADRASFMRGKPSPNRGKPSPMKGHKREPFSEDWRRHMSESHMGKKRGPLSEETKRKLSTSLAGRKIPADVIARRVATLKLHNQQRRQQKTNLQQGT